MSAYELLIIGLMFLLNGVFACYEMAIASVSHGKLASLASQKVRGARLALLMKERMEASLAVVQLGITLVGAVAAATGGAAVNESLAPFLERAWGLSHPTAKTLALAIFVFPLSMFTIAFAELVPKMIAIHNKERVCLRLSPAMYVLMQISYPAVALFEGLVKAVMSRLERLFRRKGPEDDAPFHEFTAAVGVAKTARLLGAREEKIVLTAAQFPVRPIRQIMIPASDLSMMGMKATLLDALEKAHLDLHTRFPVADRDTDPQTIRGYITFKDLVVALKMNASSGTVADIVRPIRRFPADASIAQALETLIREKTHIALVESRESDVVGMVTLEDIIEELVGDIEDEFDRLPGHIHPTGSGWIMGGGVHMDAVETAVGKTDLVQPDIKPPTLADWCAAELGRSPEKGEIFDIHGLSVAVRKLRRKRIAECFVTARKGV